MNKEETKEYKRQYYLKNKDRLNKLTKINYQKRKEIPKTLEEIEKVRQQKLNDYYRHQDKRQLQSNTWKEDNREKVNKYANDYYWENREQCLQYVKENRERILSNGKRWRKENITRAKKVANENCKRKRKSNVNYRLASILRSRILTALRGERKVKRTLDLLGCSIEYFSNYLESQFDDEMSWTNQGKFGWHIDHKIPCASFNLSETEQQKECFHYSNMQPMWAVDNWKKGFRGG